jgi:lysophospholipase L1-like esterase
MNRAAKSLSDTADRSPSGVVRRWQPAVFRLLAVFVGLSPLLVCELVLRALDLGQPAYREDPFVGFSAIHPLFAPSEDGTRYEIAQNRLAFFCPDWFPRTKTAREFRIFCLGGSTVQGEPFRKETSFTTWLELSLGAADPCRQWRVVNCGGISYASYRLVPILEEILENYQPDLILVYTGHNEFLEDRTYTHIKSFSPYVARPISWVARTRAFNLAVEGVRRLRGEDPQAPPAGRPILKDETDAMLEYRGGLARYHRDPKWRRDVIQHYRYNLRRMVQMCRERRVPLILMNPAFNLRDCPPFKAENRDDLTPPELTTWRDLVSRAAACQRKDLSQAIGLLEQAARIDDQHAGLQYTLAQCYDARNQIERAREKYLRAKEEDICPLRILEPMSRIVLEVAADTSTPLVDVRAMFEDRSEHRLLGGYLLVDHVHPSIAGHQLIAEAIVGCLEREGLVKLRSDWKKRQDRRFREHLASLPDVYFSRGMEKAERLRRWTHGQASAEPPPSWEDHGADPGR